MLFDSCGTAQGLRVQPMRFRFRAREAIAFRAGAASNTFRGALGLLLRRTACDASCPGAQTCPERATCLYARIFEPRTAGNAASGFRDQPRPFVIRAAALEGRYFPADAEFTVEVLNFDPTIEVFSILQTVFEQLAAEGLGPGRPGMELSDAARLPEVVVPLTGPHAAVAKLEIHFLTPAELKAGGEAARQPEFPFVASRARDRVSGLCRLYQGMSPEFDYAGLGQRAAAVQLTRCEITDQQFERKSSRTGQRYLMRGFTGFATYEGDLGEFLPLLRAAEFTGIGRRTVWGHGQIAVSL